MTKPILEALAEELGPMLEKQQARQIGLKHDTAGNPITIGYSHGPGGNLSWPGVDPAVFHTIIGNKGILGQLPISPSVFCNPLYSVLTGVTDDVNGEKDGVCANAPEAGLLKTCILTSPFGRYERATKELELNRLGKLNDRADPMDLALVGSPIYQGGPFAAGPQLPATPSDLLQNEISRKFWERNVSFHRLLSQQLWVGNPVNNSAGGGYMEMTGFQTLVNTGHVDAITRTSCPTCDSDLKDFNYQIIPAQCAALVNLLSYMYMYLRGKAERQGVLPVRWVMAMREELFWEVTACWPCSYLTYRCQTTTNQQVTIDGAEQVRFRDEMRTGRYLLINGERVDVVIDDGIPVHTPTTNANVNEGCMSSDIYFIPMSVVGGRAVTFLEHADYTNPSNLDALANLILARIEGAFLTWPRQTNQCVTWQSKIEPRLTMRTPWLAGRLQNVQYCPAQVVPQPFPSDPYFVDGGVTQRLGPSLWALWGQAR